MANIDYEKLRKEQDLVGGILKRGDYTLGSAATQILATFNDRPEILGYIARASLGMGHIELAEALVKGGAQPKLFSSNNFGFFSMGVFSAEAYSDEYACTIPYLLASQKNIYITETGNGLRRPRVEVLNHLSKHPGVWPDDVNHLVNGQSALVRAQSVQRKYYRWAAYGDQVYPDIQERHGFQRALIAHGADINAGKRGKTLLQSSIPNNTDKAPDWKDLDFVMSLGIDLHKQGPSAWARAIRNDTLAKKYPKKAPLGPRCQALQDRGVPLHSPVHAPEYFAPLVASVQTGHVKLVRTLLEGGADPCWMDTPTQQHILSSVYMPAGTIQQALDVFPIGSFAPVIDTLNQAGETALHMAVNSLHAPMVKRVLDEGANIDITNKQGRKPLQAMRRSGKVAQAKFDEVISILMEHGANLDTEKGATAMHKAALMLSVPAMKKLVALGHRQDLFALDASRRTPLQLAVQGHQNNVGSVYDPVRGERQVATVQFMKEQGVDILMPYKSGGTHLHDAVYRKCHLLTQYLLAEGADPYALDANKLTPIDQFDLSYYLKEYLKEDLQGKNQPYILIMVEAFVAAGVDLYAPNAKGDLPFKTVRDLDWFRVAIALLESKALHENTQQAAPSTRRMRL